MSIKEVNVQIGSPVLIPAGWSIHHPSLSTGAVAESIGLESSSAEEHRRSEVPEVPRDE